jgi:hypothetical protein
VKRAVSRDCIRTPLVQRQGLSLYQPAQKDGMMTVGYGY